MNKNILYPIPRRPSWVDYSTLSTYLSCPYKALLQYGLSIRKEAQALELVFGGANHFALEIAYQWWSKNKEATVRQLRDVSFRAFLAYWEAFATDFHALPEESLFPRSPGNAQKMLSNYFQTWYLVDKEMTLVGTELPIEFLFTLGSSPTKEETLTYVGRIDRVMASPKGRIHAYEIKTSSIMSDVIFFGYEQSFQSDGYLRFLNSFDTPKKDAPILEYDILAVQKTGNSSMRRPILKLASQVEASFQTLSRWIGHYYNDWEILSDLMSSNLEAFVDKSLHLPTFLRKKGTACTEYMRRCPYDEICRARSNPLTYLTGLPSGYIHRPWDPRLHEEMVARTMSEITQEILATPI